MSAIDRVREKFKIPMSGTSKSSKSPSAGSAAFSHTHSETHGHPSAGSAGSPHKDSEKLSATQLDAGPPVPCQGCRYFQPRTGAQPDGWCRQYATEAWADVQFRCAGYSPADPAARALEVRRQKVEAQLRADAKLCIAADIADAPLRAEPGRPVSIVLAVRTNAGMVSGELQAPRDRFDTGMFLTYLKSIPEIPS